MKELDQFRDLRRLQQELRTAVQDIVSPHIFGPPPVAEPTREERMLYLAKQVAEGIPDRITRIKILRSVFHLSLRDAKDLSDMADWAWEDGYL